MSISALQDVFKKYTREAGLSEKYSIHACRHFHALAIYKASGHNLRVVQTQLGHASISTSAVYLSAVDDDIKEAVEKL